MNRKSSTLAVAVALALGTSAVPAFAQSSAQTLDTLIVTGTRVADRTVAESQSPIDIVTPEALQSTGTGGDRMSVTRGRTVRHHGLMEFLRGVKCRLARLCRCC